MKSIFISDLHLNASEPDVYHAFRRFIHDLPVDLDELYILGDLFEAWIGDDDPDDFVAKVKNDLYGITHSGIKLKVQHGNRDFALGKRFCRETGAELIGDHHIFERYGQKALLMHFRGAAFRMEPASSKAVFNRPSVLKICNRIIFRTLQNGGLTVAVFFCLPCKQFR